jgi:hypothetical protein
MAAQGQCLRARWKYMSLDVQTTRAFNIWHSCLKDFITCLSQSLYSRCTGLAISLVSQIPSSLESPYSFRPLKNILLACNSCMGGIHCVFTDVLTTYLRAWSCHSISKAFLDKPPAKNCKSLSSTNTLDTFSSIFSTSVTTFCSYKYTHTHIYINTFHSLP